MALMFDAWFPLGILVNAKMVLHVGQVPMIVFNVY